MSLSDIKALNTNQAAMLEFDHWTVEKLAVATAKELSTYKGIGKVGAKNIIAEAAEIVNSEGLEDADRLEMERYYQKAPLAKILEDWENDGLDVEKVALSSAAALAVLKGIDEPLAFRLISKAQGIVNKRGLYQSKVIAPGAPVRETSPAFDDRWLSGEVEPPEMSVRVRKNFERAQEMYRELTL